MATLTTAQINEILSNVAKIPGILQTIGKLEICMNGNGKAGIVQTVHDHEMKIESLRETINEDRAERKKTAEKKSDRQYALYLVLIAQIIGILVSVLK